MTPVDELDVVSVSVLRWPDDSATRELLAAHGQPRLLLVPPGTPPPALLDDIEDWLREPPHADDLRARADELRRRASRVPMPSPVMDDSGLLRVGDAWVSVPPNQIPVATLLVANLERVVGYDTLVTAYRAGGGSVEAASVRSMLARLGARVQEVGLRLVAVRRRGVLLTQRPPG